MHRPGCVFCSLAFVIAAGSAKSSFGFNAPFAKLVNPHPAVNNEFGLSITALDAKLAVGAALNDLSASHAGAVYIYNPQTLQLLTTIENPHPDSSDLFGAHLGEIDGRLLVSAPFGSTVGNDRGVVYLLEPSGSVVRAFNSPSAEDFLFGRRFDARGSTLAIGAEDASSGVGAVHLFDADSGVLLRSISNPDTGSQDRFGCSVAFAGDFLAIGARENDAGGVDAGIVYLFNPNNGELVNTITNPSPSAGDWFGFELATYQDQLVVSTLFGDSGAENAGSVELFDIVTGGIIQSYTNPSPNAGEHFGYSITTADGLLVVGSVLESHSSGDRGSAYVFDLETGTLLQSLADISSNTTQEFGADAAIIGNIIAVSDNLNGALADDSGAVYLFRLVPEPQTALLLVLGISHCVACGARNWRDERALKQVQPLSEARSARGR
jgi:hypothetical protein